MTDELREEEQSVYDESYGLRFDIYERVHLSDDVVGIDQLEEVELTPHIQVIPAGDQVTVRGSLLLAGAYVGTAGDETSQTLEHWIPVEITLPLNRIRSLDDISVDIEHFDVDLLSTRTLNITGILSLNGIAMETAEPPAWEPEQFTVVHQTDAEREKEEPSWLRDYGQPFQTSPAMEEKGEISSFSPENERQSEVEQASAQHNAEEAEPDSVPPQAEDEPAEIPRTETVEQEPVSWTWSQSPWLSAVANEESPAVQHKQEPDTERFPDASETRQAEDEAADSGAALDSAVAGSHSDEANAESAIEAPVPQQREPAPAPGPGSSLSKQREPAAASSPGAPLSEQRETIAASGPGSNPSPAAEAESHHAESAQDEDAGREQAVEQADAVAIEEESVAAAVQPKPEMKVAIGSTKPAEPEAAQQLGFSSLLQSSYQTKEKEREAREAAEEEAALNEAQQNTAGDGVKWQSLFLQRVNHDTAFKKVRLCIVQREDTLETIADRYRMNSREIALYNRLAEPSVTEGQVLYIPISS
ncbi:LysM peptidoglycan-binding domain-containing protein [Paenibacillus apiarius]|uniref:LysM peptidoglycan-binding domain-containing protein n=1 Tax=Paenibacillus apiarius TaxID=46240 RepID=UPI003B3AED03